VVKLTKNEIMNMPAGRELDRVIAETGFGYEVQDCSNDILNYSTDMNDAMELARYFIRQGKFVLNYLKNESKGIGWHCNINDHHVHGCKTPTLAICRAALLATIGSVD
jgi:hypothetical protein